MADSLPNAIDGRSSRQLSPADVLRTAEEVFNLQPSWVTFFREVLGVDGIIRQAFRSPDTLATFEQTAEYRQIQAMLAKLREHDGDLAFSPREPSRVITVRLPKSLHDSLKAEAHQRVTSMNKLCISKLLLALPLADGEDGIGQIAVEEL